MSPDCISHFQLANNPLPDLTDNLRARHSPEYTLQNQAIILERVRKPRVAILPRQRTSQMVQTEQLLTQPVVEAR